jgi:hypothetical protein
MPILLFADLETLRRALVHDIVPREIGRAPVHVGIDPHGQYWLRPQSPMPAGIVSALAALGVLELDREPGMELAAKTCWAQLLPLRPRPAFTDSRTVLFELPAEQLPQLASEARRLGPGSALAFRHCDFTGVAPTVLLHVSNPPLISVMRSSRGGVVTAFMEAAARVWVEIGYQHPLVQQIEPPASGLLLIRSPSDWQIREEAPWVGEMPSFSLARQSLLRGAGAPVPRLEFSLRLVPDGPGEPADLWLLDDRAWDRFTQLAADCNSAFVARWRAAVFEAAGQTRVALWAKPSKRPPPSLLIPARGFRSHAQLPHLFLPFGSRLQPPLRRDALRRLFPGDAEQLTLLVPSDSGGYLPARLATTAFVPMEDVLRYASNAAETELEAVLPNAFGGWLDFVEAEHDHVVPSPAAGDLSVAFSEFADPNPRKSGKHGRTSRGLKGLVVRFKRRLRTHRPWEKRREANEAALRPEPPPEPGGRRHDLQERRAELEQQFLRALGPNDAAERLAVLPELASLHAQLGNFSDAAVCWLNAAWDQEAPPNYWLWGWLQVERKLGRSLCAEDDLPALIESIGTPGTVRTLAATVVWHARQETAPPGFAERAGVMRQLLEANESWLPVRAAWLAHLGLARTARGDVLALVRARDRLSERLMRHGLSLELDVPSFLRFEGRGASERFAFVREWLVRVRDPIHRWVDLLVRHRPPDYQRALPPRFPDEDGRCTKAFADLMLAWGLARLGEHNAARHLEQAARDALNRCDDPVLRLLGDAYSFRIEQGRESRAVGGPLPLKLLAALDQLTPDPDDDDRLLARYRIDVLRGRSKILEPTDRISPVRPIAVRLTADPPDPEPPTDWSPEELFLQIEVLISASPNMDQVTHALTLEQAFGTAARLGDVEAARPLVALLARLFAPTPPRFGHLAQQLLQAPFGEGYRPEELQRLELTPAQCLRSLRRLGLFAEAERFRVPAVEWILHGRSLTSLRRTQPLTWVSALRALLHLAADWFGQPDEERAVTVLEAARHSLLYATDLPPAERLSLACAYAGALGQAPVLMARGRVEELFRDLSGLYDVRQTNSHFALSPLVLVDAVVRAAVSDEFSLAPAARRWLDADEFRVRQRMRQDLAKLTEQV